jgi:hypothetical protein
MKAFVNARVNAGTEDGRKVAARYHVHGYPTLVVVDASGSEIDRIVGYRPPETFLPEVQRILRGEGTLPALRKKADEAPEDVAKVVAYAEKLIDSDPQAAAGRLQAIAESVVSEDREVEAHKWLVLARAVEACRGQAPAGASALDLYTKVARDFGGTDAWAEALRRGAWLANRLPPDRAQHWFDTVRQAATSAKERALIEGLSYDLYMQLAARALKAKGDAAAAAGDAQQMNAVAWTVYEHRTDMPFRRYLRVALAWAQKAAEISKRDPAILDTWACLLSTMRRYDEAIQIETEAFGKATSSSMKLEFAKNLSEWTTQRDALAARHAVPAVPLVPR